MTLTSPKWNKISHRAMCKPCANRETVTTCASLTTHTHTVFSGHDAQPVRSSRLEPGRVCNKKTSTLSKSLRRTFFFSLLFLVPWSCSLWFQVSYAFFCFLLGFSHCSCGSTGAIFSWLVRLWILITCFWDAKLKFRNIFSKRLNFSNSQAPLLTHWSPISFMWTTRSRRVCIPAW